MNVKESRLLVSHGKEIEYNEFPWIAAIFNRHSTGLDFNCGGSLVSARHIVTAAHCVKNEEKKTILHPDDLVVYMGKHLLTNFEDREDEVQGFSISRIIVHSDWTKTTAGKKDGDIAVLVLSNPVNFTESVQPVCLFGENVVSRTEGAVVGWGLDETGSISQVPNVITMPAVSRDVCEQSDDRFIPIVSNRTFCAGHRNGDSGGGFYTKSQFLGDNKRTYLSGIVSRSLTSPKNTCDLNHFIVFTEVQSYRPWIQCILHDPACPVESKSVDDYKDIKSRIRVIFARDFMKNGKSYTMIIAIAVCAIVAVLVAIVVYIHILRKHRLNIEEQVRQEAEERREREITKKTVSFWKTEAQKKKELRALNEQEEPRERPCFFRRTWNGFTRIFTRTRSEEERVMESLMADIIPAPRSA
ncbi:hypothetical protein B566_EDAN015961 [Ephemera danica]|nr:hypothetical protein B566_EDAN015961 [Ephemera danica]